MRDDRVGFAVVDIAHGRTHRGGQGPWHDCLAAYVCDPEGIIIDPIEDLPADTPAG